MPRSRFVQTASCAMTASALIASQPAFADDYIYRGDCERAKIVRNERPITQLFPHSFYYGAQRFQSKDETCGREQFASYRLVYSSINKNSIKYKFSLKLISYNKTEGQCQDPEYSDDDLNGTIEIYMQEQQYNNVCTLSLMAKMSATDEDGKPEDMEFKLVWLNKDEFAISMNEAAKEQGEPGSYYTSAIFIGTNF